MFCAGRDDTDCVAEPVSGRVIVVGLVVVVRERNALPVVPVLIVLDAVCAGVCDVVVLF